MNDRISYTPRRRKCLGSKNAENQAVKDNPALANDKSVWSEMGDDQHARLHKNDFAGASADEMKALTDVIRMAADVEQDIMGECERPLKVYKEVTLHIPLPDGSTIEGHPDKVLVGFHKEHGWFALIIDYKFGFNEVESAEENDQLRGYALGLRSIVDVPIAKTFCRIIQRFASHNTTVYTPEDLITARADLLAVYAATDAPDAPRTPSIDACRYCKALGTTACPETKNMVEQAAHIVTVNALTAEDISHRLEVFKMAESIIKKERAIYKEMIAKNPGCIPGWEIEEGDNVRSIPEVAKAHAILHAIVGDKFQDALKLSVPDLEEIVCEATGTPAAKGKAKLAELLGDVLVNKQKAGSLAQTKKGKK